MSLTVPFQLTFTLKVFSFNNKRLVSVWIAYFSLFLLLFIDFTALFSIIHESHRTILVNFYFYLHHFQQKNFQFQQNKRISNIP